MAHVRYVWEKDAPFKEKFVCTCKNAWGATTDAAKAALEKGGDAYRYLRTHPDEARALFMAVSIGLTVGNAAKKHDKAKFKEEHETDVYDYSTHSWLKLKKPQREWTASQKCEYARRLREGESAYEILLDMRLLKTH